MKKSNRQIRKRVKELQKAMELAGYYAFMLTDPDQHVADDKTIRCVIACVNNQCYASDCIVYVTRPMRNGRMSLLN